MPKGEIISKTPDFKNQLGVLFTLLVVFFTKPNSFLSNLIFEITIACLSISFRS
jgi:hypothetical protein